MIKVKILTLIHDESVKPRGIVLGKALSAPSDGIPGVSPPVDAFLPIEVGQALTHSLGQLVIWPWMSLRRNTAPAQAQSHG